MFTNNPTTKKNGVLKVSLTLLSLLLAAITLLGPMAGAALANEQRTQLCHLAGNGRFRVIQVGDPSIDAHLAHGDLIVGVDVDANCEPLVQDSDGDGIADDVDNCVDVANPGQEDSYGSAAGDACEDTNGDGTPDTAEANFCVSIDGVLLISVGTAVCDSTPTVGAEPNVAIANGNYAIALALEDMIVFGSQPSNNLNASAIGNSATAWARAGDSLTATAHGELALAISHSGTNSSATAIGNQANAQVFFGDNNHASATEQAYTTAGNGNNNTATASGIGSGAQSGYGNNNTAISTGGEQALAWFASDMSATSTSAYTCTNETGEVALDEDKCN